MRPAGVQVPSVDVGGGAKGANDAGAAKGVGPGGTVVVVVVGASVVVVVEGAAVVDVACVALPVCCDAAPCPGAVPHDAKTTARMRGATRGAAFRSLPEY